MKTDEAIDLIIHAVEKSIGGETFVMKMPAVKVKDIAKAMIEYLLTKIQISSIGTRPGEKMHEKLLSSSEVMHAYEFDTKYFVILRDK